MGKPLPTSQAHHERLGNVAALAVFSSDALSSVAYATEEILLVLALVGGAIHWQVFPISIGIVGLLAIVALSYRQTVHAYSDGGGAYLVAKDNLGTLSGLVAGAALLIDYVLTVAVSVAAGIWAIVSAAPALAEYRVSLALLAVALVALANLRGVRESGALFAAPAFAFIGGILLLIGAGLTRLFLSSVFHVTPIGPIVHAVEAPLGAGAHALQPLTLFVLLRAFASGCTAMTGIEAISNGVTAFRPPEADNAGKVLRWLTVILAILFLGISLLAWLYGVVPSEHETVVSQIARRTFGHGAIYLFIQVSTCTILILAANTSFAGFPRLASRMAHDLYLPRQLANLGDRLVFSNGVLLLAGAAAGLLILFNADTHRLIPLYAVGVFLSFTLSQAGMVVRWLKTRGERWVRRATLNGVGALATGVVLGVIVATKFTHGAWLVCVLLPVMVYWFFAVRRHYRSAGRQLVLDALPPPRALRHTVLVPVAGIHRGVLSALEYARSITNNVRAVTVKIDDAATERLLAKWREWGLEMPLVVLESPYRSLTEPLIEYIEKVDREDPDDIITVVLPEFVPPRLWQNFLHNQSNFLIHAALRGLRGVVVTTVRMHLRD